MNPVGDARITVRAAQPRDISVADTLIRPFVARGDLLPRTDEELALLLTHAFLAIIDGVAVGFVALEIYSRKLAEIQCLSFEETSRVAEIITALIQQCLQRAQEHVVLEVMAVVSRPLEAILLSCGFAYALPNHKHAMFLRSELVDPRLPAKPPLAVTIGAANVHDLPAVAQFLAPFVAHGEILRRGPDELTHLLGSGFLAKADGRIVGFVALDIYSERLAEIQCLSVDEAYRGQGIGQRLVMLCVRHALENNVAETMAISAHDELFISCGFEFCLPGPKTALFFRTHEQ